MNQHCFVGKTCYMITYLKIKIVVAEKSVEFLSFTAKLSRGSFILMLD